MSKKKVVLNDNPLEAQTIGVVKKHNFGLLVSFLVMAIFGVVIYFLPDIMPFIDKIFKPATGSGQVATNNTSSNYTNNTVPNNPDTPTSQKEIKYLKLNEDNKVTFSDVSFESITYDKNQIIITIVSNTDSTLLLYNKHYYLHIYDENKNLISNYFFSNAVNGWSTVVVNANDAVYYSIEEYQDTDYPYFVTEPDKDDRTYLTCTRNNESIKYTFESEKLILIDDVITVDVPTDTIRDQYNSLKSSYDNIAGLTVNIQDSVPYVFTINVDVLKYVGTVKAFYFNKDAYVREIKYKMDTMNFTCR